MIFQFRTAEGDVSSFQSEEQDVRITKEVSSHLITCRIQLRNNVADYCKELKLFPNFLEFPSLIDGFLMGEENVKIIT